MLASGVKRYAVPTWTAEAPRAKAAATPRRSAMPPAATTETNTASDLRHKRECSELRGHVLGQEAAPMSTRFPAHGDHDIDAMRLEAAGLGDGRGR